MERIPFALWLAYDGAAFRGWQRQPGLASVQQAVEQALEAALGRPLAVFGASRTDAGVHAEGQVVHFHARLPVDPAALAAGLRAHLPASVELRAAARAHRSFHARSSAVGKRYRYVFSWGERPAGAPPSFWLGASAGPRWERARDALAQLHRLPHLSGLASPSRDPKPAPPLDAWSLEERHDERGGAVVLWVRGAAFRKHQIRNLAGHLAAIALGLAEPASLPELAALHRPWRGATAPPHGLTLVEVLYPRELDPFPELRAPDSPGGQERPLGRRRGPRDHVGGPLAIER